MEAEPLAREGVALARQLLPSKDDEVVLRTLRCACAAFSAAASGSLHLNLCTLLPLDRRADAVTAEINADACFLVAQVLLGHHSLCRLHIKTLHSPTSRCVVTSQAGNHPAGARAVHGGGGHGGERGAAFPGGAEARQPGAGGGGLRAGARPHVPAHALPGDAAFC